MPGVGAGGATKPTGVGAGVGGKHHCPKQLEQFAAAIAQWPVVEGAMQVLQASAATVA